MKKSKRVLNLILAVAMVVVSVGLFGCGIEPWEEDTWYLTSYTDEQGRSHSVGENYLAQTRLYSDDITLRYSEYGSFTFKEFDKTYTGTFTYKKGNKETVVSLIFSDGTKGSGTCAEYMFDGSWYEVSLTAFGKTYEFSDEWKEEGDDEERNHTPYTTFGKTHAEWIKGDIDVLMENGRVLALRGSVELRDDRYIFVPSNPDRSEMDLSAANSLYTYEVAADLSGTRGTNTLREGQCFVMYKMFSVRQESGDRVDTYYSYAVWYYTLDETPSASLQMQSNIMQALIRA